MPCGAFLLASPITPPALSMGAPLTIVFPPARVARGGQLRPYCNILGPIWFVRGMADADGYIADGVFLSWSNRRPCARHWRMPDPDDGTPIEEACCREAGDRGVNHLCEWLTGLNLFSGEMLQQVLLTVAPYLHALAPTDATVALLLQHRDPRLRLETQMHTPSAPMVKPPRKRTAKRRR